MAALAIGFFVRQLHRDLNFMDQYCNICGTTRSVAIVILAMALLPAGGCRICADCEDLAYPAYGGSWQRTRRDGGRVGSLFDPAGAKTSALVDRDRPEESGTLERAPSKRLDEPDAEPDRMPEDSSDQTERDFEDKASELRDLKLEDIDVTPGDPPPPSLN